MCIGAYMYYAGSIPAYPTNAIILVQMDFSVQPRRIGNWQEYFEILEYKPSHLSEVILIENAKIADNSMWRIVTTKSKTESLWLMNNRRLLCKNNLLMLAVRETTDYTQKISLSQFALKPRNRRITQEIR